MASAYTESASMSQMKRMPIHPKHFNNKAISQSWISGRRPRFTSDNVPLLLAANPSLQRAGDEFCSDDEEVNNESALELCVHGNASVPLLPDMVFKDIQIRAEDTLINLAVRYNCSMSDLKRYNKLSNNNDLYALNVLRVPVLRQDLVGGEVMEEENKGEISSLKSSGDKTTVALPNCNSLKYPECESTCDSNINIADENCESYSLIHTANDYSPARLKYIGQSRGHEQVARLFRDADITVQNIASTLPEISANVDELEVSDIMDETEAKHRHDSSLTWFSRKMSWRLIVVVCVALLFALGLLLRQFLF